MAKYTKSHIIIIHFTFPTGAAAVAIFIKCGTGTDIYNKTNNTKFFVGKLMGFDNVGLLVPMGINYRCYTVFTTVHIVIKIDRNCKLPLEHSLNVSLL